MAVPINWKKWAFRVLKVFGWFVLLLVAFYVAQIAFLITVLRMNGGFH
jgi:hypothetical protein